MDRRKLLLVELNEFDPDFLREIAVRLKLDRLIEALSFPHSTTSTRDEVEHQGLDPWVQWVNVHTGMESSEHGVKRLGETERQTMPQIWTIIGDAGLSWGAWGVMNAPRQSAPGCKFFFPDPWSYAEVAYPDALNDLLALPRYAGRSYLELDRVEMVRHALKFLRALARPEMWGASAAFARAFFGHALKKGVTIHTFSTLLDYISTLAFVRLRRIKQPDFSVIFLNNVAHLQHQFWSRSSLHPEMELGLRLTDKMLGVLIDSLRDSEALILMNGLRQRNVEGAGFCVYRQKNPQKFIERLGLTGVVEQCMTNDAHIICKSPIEADRVESAMRNCRLLSGAVPFFVERVSPEKVFYQINLEGEIGEGERLICGNVSIPFEELIELYARRTGAHVRQGDLYTQKIYAPPTLMNNEVHKLIAAYFNLTPAPSTQCGKTA